MRIGKTVLGAAAAAVLCVGFAFAQDGQTDVAQSGAAPQAQAPTFDESLLDVPEGKDLGFYKERMQQIQTGVRAFAQSNPSEEDLARVKEKIVDAFLVIFPALIADEELDEERRSGMVVHYAAFLSHKGELDKLQACIDSETAKEEPDARLVANLKSFLVIPKIRQAGQAKDSAGLQAAVDEYIDIVMTTDSTVGSAKAVVDAVKEYDAELAKSALTKMIAAFKTSDGGLRKRFAEVLEEEQRLNNLVGNDMLVEGLYLDGSEIKWDEYRGKVVLVDFFATWRRPCMQEIPNVKSLYDKYHDAGFEVLSYSVDTDLDALKKFEEEAQIPWKTASSELSAQKKNDKDEPVYKDLSAYYGISTIPRMILVGKDGKVIATDARSPRLAELLQQHFPNVK